MTGLSLLENWDGLDTNPNKAEFYRRRFIHCHYLKNTEQYNKLHYAALKNSSMVVLRRLFYHSSFPWGE